MKSKLIMALRWVGIIPVACITYLLGYALLMLMNWVTVKMYGSDAMDGWMYNYVWPVIATGAAAYYFVVIGILTAPSNKKTVALILMVLLCLLSGAAFMGIALTEHYIGIFSGIANIIGAVIAYIEIEKDN